MIVETDRRIRFQVAPEEKNLEVVEYVVRGERKSLFLPEMDLTEQVVLPEDRAIFDLISSDLHEVTTHMLSCRVSKQHPHILLPRLNEQERDFFKLLAMNFNQFVDHEQAKQWVQRNRNESGVENIRFRLSRMKEDISAHLLEFNGGEYRVEAIGYKGYRFFKKF